MNAEYELAIDNMAYLYDLYKEIPIHRPDFQEAIRQKLLKDESGLQYTHYRYLPLFEEDYSSPYILQLLSDYIQSNGDLDKEIKIALKLTERLIRNIGLYFKDDIENDIVRKWEIKYCTLFS